MGVNLAEVRQKAFECLCVDADSNVLALFPGSYQIDALEQTVVVGHGGLAVGEGLVEVSAPHLAALDEQGDDTVARGVGQGLEHPDSLSLEVGHMGGRQFNSCSNIETKGGASSLGAGAVVRFGTLMACGKQHF